MKKHTYEAAFFDIDGTIIKGNTAKIYMMHFLKKGRLSPKALFLAAKLLLKYKLLSADYEDAMKESYKAIKGLDVKETEKIIKKYYPAGVSPKIYEEIRKIIKQHKKDGRMIIFVTNAWKPMAEDIAKELKADMLFSTETEIIEGRYTGEILFACHGKKKADIMAAAANNYNISLKKSYAYGDHYSDRHMLEAAGNPVAINPGPKLKRYAKEKGWTVIRLR